MRPRLRLFLTSDEFRKLSNECSDYETLVWFLGWLRFRSGEAVALRTVRYRST